MRKNISNIHIGFLFLILSACASPKKEKPVDVTAPPQVTGPRVPPPIIIDYVGLQQTLNVNRRPETMGYLEKSFDTCKVGHGYPSDRDCRRDVFVLIHFKLLCRDAHESSHTAFDASRMSAMSGHTVRWSIKNKSGEVVLDEEGQGQVRTTLTQSGKQQRVKLAIANDALYMRASDIGRIVVPPNWCGQ